jgi:hypothetical protein
MTDKLHDLRLALHAAAALRQTIRDADTKAQVLLGVQGGTAVVVLQELPALGDTPWPGLLVVAAVSAAGWLGGLAVGGWCLLSAMNPRLAGAYRTNRFAFPAARPAGGDAGEQRDEAWDLVAVLSDIALAKHARVRRALPALIAGSVSAGVLLALAAVVGIAT